MTINIQEILEREIENKKSFNANYDTQCTHCRGFIAEGEEFYFFGNKEKTCQTCFDEILEYIKYGR